MVLDSLNILDSLYVGYGTDLRGYHPETVTRRVARRLAATGCIDFTEYTSYLQEHPSEYELLVDTLTIKVTSFFRDPLIFAKLANTVFPELIKERVRQQRPFLSIWSAGCATGQEVYSTAILLDSLLVRNRDFVVRIVGTDINSRALRAATRGSYTSDGLGEINNYYLERYFIKQNDTYAIIPRLHSMVIFGYYNLLNEHNGGPKEGIFSSYDVILCRNVLMYYERNKQMAILGRLTGMLNAGGYLVLGKTEFLPSSLTTCLQEISPGSKIYRKEEGYGE